MLPYEQQTANILIIDDEPANIKVLEKTLNREGFSNITSTTDPRDGVAFYQANPFDLVLLDLNMPHMNGFEVLDKIRELSADEYPPVLILTAQSDRDSRLRALDGGARDFITKPFDRVELLTRIRNMLEVRLLHKTIKNQNVILEQKVLERTKELHETRLEIVRRLGRAAEYRDNETGLHIIRMSKYSQLIGLKHGMNELEADNLLNASPMHDIGKLGIPDAVLLKPGKLNEGEWEIMKQHPTIGAEILSNHTSELMEIAQSIALNHHEKWDGTGYPRGLAGCEIPLSARIVAIADVFDALTSERPYKNAWPVEEATQYIMDNRGKHFDPELVDHFAVALSDILIIKEQYSEPVTDNKKPLSRG